LAVEKTKTGKVVHRVTALPVADGYRIDTGNEPAPRVVKTAAIVERKSGSNLSLPVARGGGRGLWIAFRRIDG
jgi:hypothetical protein